MIKPPFILGLFLLVAFLPTRPGTLWRVGSTVGVIFTLNWMNTRIEQNEILIRKMYAHVTGKSESSVNEDFPPKGLGEASSQLIKDVKPYVKPVVDGVKKIFDEGMNSTSEKNHFHTSMDPSGISTIKTKDKE